MAMKWFGRALAILVAVAGCGQVDPDLRADGGASGGGSGSGGATTVADLCRDVCERFADPCGPSSDLQNCIGLCQARVSDCGAWRKHYECLTGAAALACSDDTPSAPQCADSLNATKECSVASPPGGSPICILGDVRTCECASGGSGVSYCTRTGTFGPCVDCQ